MSTSLAEQLRRLAVPQTSILVDSKKRPSILFDPKEAANKDRRTIYDLGRSGLMELINIKSTFAQFEQTLFDQATMKLERSVESASVNKIIDKNIRKFFYHLSPYFMLQPAHLCLEWLIRRFHIHEFNKNDLIGLILPYHETKIFVKCVQLLNLKESNDPWKWLEPIQKPGVPLSKTAILNRAANDKGFLKFICEYTGNSIKELDSNAQTLQTQINFYYTTIIGGLENAKEITESHILTILPTILKGFDSNVIDFVSANLMITIQLCCKTKLKQNLLDGLIGKICEINFNSMQNDIILALIIIYQRQTENLIDFNEENLMKLIEKSWIPIILAKLSTESIRISTICCPLIKTCLKVIKNRNDNSNKCKEFLEILLNEIRFSNDDIENLIRCILDNYYQSTKLSKKRLSENEIIEIDSDDNDDEIMTEIDVQLWYSQYLQQLEKQYPTEFDNVVKQIMQEDEKISKSRKQTLKTILGFRLKSSYFKDNTTIYENLYHHNSNNRIESVKYLINNFNNLQFSNDNLLKCTLKDRLLDDNPNVVKEILKLSSNDLIKLIDNQELINILIEILCKCQTIKEWSFIIPLALNHLTQREIYQNTDYNRILLAIIPFIIIVTENELKNARIVFQSDFSRELSILRTIIMEIDKLTTPKEISNKILQILYKTHELPTINELLKSFYDITDDRFTKLFNISYLLLLLEISCTNRIDENSGLEIIELLIKIKNKFNLLHIQKDDEWLAAIRENKIPLNLYINLFKSVVKGIKFDNLKKINLNLKSHKIYLKVFDYLLTNAFTKTEKQGKIEYEQGLKDIMEYCFELKQDKLEFLSNFFVIDRLPNYDNNIELQIRSIRLFNFILMNSNDNNYKIDNLIFVKLLIGLSSKIDVVRECTLNILEILLNTENVLNEKYKFIISKILQHSEEIQMHNEHLSLILSLIASNKKNKNNFQETEYFSSVLNDFLCIINDSSIEICLKAELLEILKHITNTKILKKILILGLEILQSYDNDNDEANILNSSEAKIYNLIAVRFDETTIKLLNEDLNAWNFIEKSFNLHKILLWDNNNEKYVSIVSCIIENFDEHTYNGMPEKYKIKFLELLVNAVTFNDKDNTLLLNAKKFLKHIQLNGEHVIRILEKMKNKCNNKTPSPSSSSQMISRRNEIKNLAPDPQLLNSIEWKNGITLLEFLQNKKKFDNYKILIPILFDILKQCLDYEEQFNLEYIKQLILSCLLLLCQKLLDKPLKEHELSQNAFKVDLIVQCIRGTQNSQTHHHALLLLTNCALIMPHQVLHNIVSIFTFMGSSVVRHDDAFSFQIISNIIESIIPTLIQASSNSTDSKEYKDELVIPVLKVFGDIILDVPEHRRIPLYIKLINTLGASKYLWMFLCVIFESHVMHDNKKTKNTSLQSESKLLSNSLIDELPKRIEIALQIIKNFQSSVTIETCSELFVYLKKLPIDKPDDKNDNMKIDCPDSVIFNIDNHTSKQLRHYKYIILQFINTFLTSTEFLNEIALHDTNDTINMKQYYQKFIINILNYVPDVNNAMETIKLDNNQIKFWKVILYYCYDILDNVISLLEPNMLLMVLHGLMQHKLISLRKRIIDILINKLQRNINYFDNCNEDNLIKLLEPLENICNTIIDKNNKQYENVTINELIYVQQTGLIAIKILSKLLFLKHPEKFKQILLNLINILKYHQNLPKILLATIALTIAEISSNLRAYSISYLPKFMPLLIQLLNDQMLILNNQLPDNVCIALITGLQKLFEVLPLFLGPYIVDILLILIKIWIKCINNQQNETKCNIIITKLTTIWTKISTTIPLRILIPCIDKIYTKLINDKEYNGIEYLMKLLKENFNHSSDTDIQLMLNEITTMFLNILEFRSKYIHEIDNDNNNDINNIEECIIQAFIALTLKLSESSFRPLYHKIYDWAFKDYTINKEKIITYFYLSYHVAESLQSLFVLFATDFLQQAADLLDKCNLMKTKELYFNETIKNNPILIEYILRTLYYVFLYDSKGFINSNRFDILMQPIVDQLENPLLLSSSNSDNNDEQKLNNLQELLLSTLSQMAVAVNNDALWKQLNYQILLKTRDNNPNIRILSFNCCIELAKKLGDNFNSLLPETIPFIAELFEDEIQRVEISCKIGVQELEKILGESLQKYFS